MVLVAMRLLAGLVFALQAEEGVLLAPLVETHHPRLLAVDALREVLNAHLTCLGTLLLFH
jgi:hypothetical protein